MKSILTSAVAKGATIVAHGETHQYDSTPNLQNAVSGNDFEFWYAVRNRPVDEDSEPWAEGRMSDAISEFTTNGYKVAGWAAPQYQMSANASMAAAVEFPTSFQRAVYYTATNPQIGTGCGKSGFFGRSILPVHHQQGLLRRPHHPKPARERGEAEIVPIPA